MLILNKEHVFVFEEKFSGKNKSVVHKVVDMETGTGRRRIYSNKTDNQHTSWGNQRL